MAWWPWGDRKSSAISITIAEELPRPPRITAHGIALIKVSEGLRLNPYLCSSNVPTIAYGSTRGFDGLPITLDHREITVEEAGRLFERDLLIFSRSVARRCRVPVTDNQFSALCSLCYNIGQGNFRASTLLRKLNRGDYDGCENEFWKWRRSLGVIMPGLVKRRELERLLFISTN